MNYEKPQIKFQKFYTESFLEENISANNEDPGHETPFGNPDTFNVDIVLESTGVGGWFNG